MKVLIGLTRSDTIVGGAFTHIRQIGNAFRAQGSQVVYVLGGDGVANDKLRGDGFKVVSLPLLRRELRPGLDLLVLLQLVWLILRERPTTCTWHTAKIGALGRIAAWLTRQRSYYVAHGVPFVASAHNTGYKLYERLERWLAMLPSKIICVCCFDRNEYLRIGVGPHKLMTIPNGMRGKPFDGLAAPAEAKALRFVTAARFETQKDFETLGAACHALQARNLPFELHIFGDGAQEQQVRRCFAGLPEGRVVFRGVVDDFAAELVQCDVFVLSSRWEGLPRSIIEAMACGRPVIASNVGGVAELVDHEASGYLVPMGDATAFGAAMAAYVTAPALRLAHGSAGLKKYQGDYTLDVMLKRYCAEYLQAAA